MVHLRGGDFPTMAVVRPAGMAAPCSLRAFSGKMRRFARPKNRT
jgi:hypothetical protein